MTSTGTRKPRDVQARANDALIENDKNFIANLKLFSGESEPVAGDAGQGSQSSPASPAGNYLARQGDSMIGPLALGPPEIFRVEIAVDESINISPNLQNPQFSSNLELDSVQPNTFVLTRIDGAAFDGQLLIIRTFGPDPFTISQATMANGGNIQTPDDADFELPALSMMYLVFDEALIVFANTGGTWRVLPGVGAGGGAHDPIVLKNLDEKDFGDQSLQLISIDWQVANFQRWRATGDNQIQFTNEPVAGKWEPMIIQITMDGVGGHDQNWNDAPFANGTPIVDTTANAVSTFRFYNYFDGANNVIYWSFWDTNITASQTPWLSNIDADKFILFDLNEIIFTNTVLNAPAIGLNTIFWSNSSGAMVHQTQGIFKIIQGNSETVGNTVATFSQSLIDFSIQTLPFTLFEAGDMIVNGISQYNDRMTLKTSNVVFPQPNFSPSVVVAGANDGGDLGTNTRYWNNLNVKQIRLRDADVIIDINSIAFDSFFGGTIYNVLNGDSHFFKQFDGVSSTDTLFEINETEIDAFTKNIVNVVDPVAPQDAATKAYVDSFVGGTWKVPVRAKADGFTFLFPNIQQVIDGVTLVEDDRVLLTDELNGKNNGIWKVNAAFAGIPLQAPLIRPDDFNSDSDMVSEVIVAVEEGDLNAYSVWQLRTPNPIIDNVTSQDWGNLRPGGITDVKIGILNATDFGRQDDQREWFGNDNGSDNIGTVLGTTEPVGTAWTFSYTFVSSDRPSGPLGFVVTNFGFFSSAQFENVGAGFNDFRSKWFLNGTEISSNGGNFQNQFAGRTGLGNRDIVVGDTIQLKAWCPGGDGVSQTLEAIGFYLMIGVAQCDATSITLSWPDDDSFDVLADYPVGVAPSSFLYRNMDDFGINFEGDGSAGASVGFIGSDANAIVYGDFIAHPPGLGASGSYDSATKSFLVPRQEFWANYRTVNK